MKRVIFLNLVFVGSLAFTGQAVAQAPGSASPGQSAPMSNPSQRPGMNNPSDTSTNQQPASKMDDNKFVKDAALGGMAEVELGKLALQKSSDNDVKQFAQQMIDDHSKANDQLKQAATQDKIEVPNSLDAKHQALIDKLSAMSGAQFDKAYIKNQLKDHETVVREFNAEAQNGSDPNVKAFASSALPTVQEHLNRVKTLSKSENGRDKQAKSSS